MARGTRRPIELEFTSRLRASADEVWAVVSTMEGVNAELRPLVSMSVPREFAGLDISSASTGSTLFASWLLAGGVVPFDRHRLALERVLPGIGFDEESTSWLQRRWRHERRVVAGDEGGCVVTDRLVVEPRFAVARPAAAFAVERIFRHRHRRLRRRFGEA